MSEANRERVGIIIGTGIGGIQTILDTYEVMKQRGPDRVSPFLIPMMISDSAAGVLAIRTGARGPNMALATACATGTNAIGEGAGFIRRSEADVMLVGAAEAAIVPLAIAGLNAMTALSTRNEAPEKASRPFDKDRDGFLMAEGAAVLVIESLESAQARGAADPVRVLGIRHNRRCLSYFCTGGRRRRRSAVDAAGPSGCQPAN